jgi:hypothetical protein
LYSVLIFIGPLKKKRKQYLENPSIGIPRSTRHFRRKKNVLCEKRLFSNEYTVENDTHQDCGELPINNYTQSGFNEVTEDYEGTCRILVVDSISRIKSPFRFKSLFIAIIIWAAVY